jgi:hypothetical protein
MSEIELIVCIICSEVNQPGKEFCIKCGHKFNPEEDAASLIKRQEHRQAIRTNYVRNYARLIRWLAAYIAATVILFGTVIAFAFSGSSQVPGVIGWITLIWLATHFATFFYAYRVNLVLNEEGLYKPGAWQMAVAPVIGFLIFGMILVLGWLLVLTFVLKLRAIRNANPSHLLFSCP